LLEIEERAVEHKLLGDDVYLHRQIANGDIGAGRAQGVSSLVGAVVFGDDLEGRKLDRRFIRGRSRGRRGRCLGKRERADGKGEPVAEQGEGIFAFHGFSLWIAMRRRLVGCESVHHQGAGAGVFDDDQAGIGDEARERLPHGIVAPHCVGRDAADGIDQIDHLLTRCFGETFQRAGRIAARNVETRARGFTGLNGRGGADQTTDSRNRERTGGDQGFHQQEQWERP
jgi:hypothetical protein